MTPVISSALRSTGSAVPSRVVTNEDISKIVDTSDEWIRTRTGIRERRFLAEGERGSDLGVRASIQALERAGLKPTDLDMLVCATISPDMMCPANGNLIAAALGCGTIPSFDVMAACSGFVYAASVANAFIRSGQAKHILVVGAEAISRSIDMTDRNTCILFGDAAGAAIFSATDAPNVGIRKVRLHSDGASGNLIKVPSQVSAHSGIVPPLTGLQMQGREVFRFAVTKFREMIELGLADAAAEGAGVDLIVPHQVNQRIIDSALQSLGLPADKVVVNLDRFGNTSAASIPLAMDEAFQQGRVPAGGTILLVGFGGGLTWGSVLIRV